MNRTAIREQAFKLIYSLEIQKQENLQESIDLFIENNKIDNNIAKEYIIDAIFGIEKNKKTIIEQIEKNLKIWTLSV